MIREFARRHAFSTYYGVALTIALGVMAISAHAMLEHPRDAAFFQNLWAWLAATHHYTNIYSIALFSISEGYVLGALVFVYAGAPAMSAVFTSSLAWGGDGLRALLSRLKPWRGDTSAAQGIRVYLLLFGLFFVGAAAFLCIAAAFSNNGKGFTSLYVVLGNSPLTAVLTLLIGIFIDEGGSLEELGWRGFALPMLQERLGSPLKAALLLGVLWWAWHLPRDLPTILSGQNLGAYAIGQLQFLTLCLALTILATYFVNRTGGSILPAVMIHGGTNVWSKALGGPAYDLLGTDLRTWIVVAGALLILWIGGTRLGLDEGQTGGFLDQRSRATPL